MSLYSDRMSHIKASGTVCSGAGDLLYSKEETLCCVGTTSNTNEDVMAFKEALDFLHPPLMAI